MIFKQETVESWFTGINTSISNEVIQPFKNAEQVIWKYNQAIQNNSLTQQGWTKLLAQSDDGLKAYLTSVKGSIASIAEYNVTLQGTITGFTKVSSAIKQYNTFATEGIKEQNAFATAVSTTNGKLGTYLTGLNGAKASLSGYGISLIASTAKTIGLTIAASALNTTLTMGISLIVSGIISAFTAWIHKSEKIAEAAQEAADKIRSINNDLKTNIETVENAKKRYAELAQEVENLGKITQSKGTLSNEEYEEFLNLSNQLAKIFPSLSKNYDENGNAILNLSGNVDTIVSSLDSLIQKEKELANQKIMKEFPDVFRGWTQYVSDSKQNVKIAKTEFDKINNAYQQLSKGSVSQAFDLQGNGWFTNENGEKIAVGFAEYEQALKDLGIEYKKTNIMVKNQFGGDTLSGYLIEATGDIDIAFTSKLEKARQDLQYAQQQLEGETSSINQYLNTWFQTEFSYNQVEDSGLQKAIQETIFNFDWNSLPEGIDKNDWDAVSEYLRRNILFSINNIDDSKVSESLSDIYSGALTSGELLESISKVQEYFGTEHPISNTLQSKVSEIEPLVNNVKEKLQDDFDDKVGELTLDELQIAAEQIEVSDGTPLSWDELKAKIKEIQSLTSTFKNPISSFSQAWNNLDTTTDETLKNVKDELLALAEAGQLSSDSLKTIDGAEEYFAKIGLSAKDASNAINKMVTSSSQLSSMRSGITSITGALNEKMSDGLVSADTLGSFDVTIQGLNSWTKFQEIMGNSHTSMEEVQEAANKLATEYVNSSNFLSHLTEANKDYYISQLEEMGVTNALEVVNASLINSENMLAVAKSEVVKYSDTLTNSKERNRIASINLANASTADIQALYNEANAAGVATNGLFQLLAQKYNVSNLSVATAADCNNLANLYSWSTAASSALNTLARTKAAVASGKYIPEEELKGRTNYAKSQIDEANKTNVNTNVNVGGNNYNSGGGGGGKDKSSSSKTLIDWIERRFNVLIQKAERWSKLIENTTNTKRLDSYYKKLEENYKKQLKSYADGASRYLQKANSIKLSSNLKNKVKSKDSSIFNKNGSMKSYKNLIKEYGEKTAKKIQDYQNYIDKYESALDNFIEATQKLYQSPIEKAADKIELLSESLNLLEAKLNNISVNDYKEANVNLDEQSDNAKSQLEARQEAERIAIQNYNSTKSAVTKKKNSEANDLAGNKKKRDSSSKAIKNAVDKGEEIDLTLYKAGSSWYKAAVKYNAALKAQKDAIQAVALSQEEYTKILRENEKAKFDNIKQYYDSKIKLLDNKFTSLDNKISEIETSGNNVHKSYYQSQKDYNNDIKNSYEEEKAQLALQLEQITQGTDEWYDAKDAIQECDNKISDCIKKTYDLNNAINELRFNMFNDIAESIDRIITEQEFLQDLFAHEKLTDDKTGTFTEAGLAKLGSLSASYYASQKKANNTGELLNELQNVKLNGGQSDGKYKLGNWEFNSLNDLQKKIDETYTQWQDDIKETYNLESEIVDLMKEKYQTELDMLKELIDAKQSALDAEKDLHDYQKNLSEKTNNITNIQKQIAAYSGDTSQEAMAKLQKLQKELSDQQEDLRETEYDRYISDQKDMMDKLYEEYEQLITKKLEDFMKLVREGLEIANQKTADISEYLTKIAEDNEYKIETDGLFDAETGNISGPTAKIIDAIIKHIKIDDSSDNNPGKTENNPTPSGSELEKSKLSGLDTKTSFSKPVSILESSKPVTVLKSSEPMKKDDVVNFINKYGSAPEKNKKYGKVNEKILDEYSKVLSPAKMKELAKLLGIKYDTNEIHNKLKSLKVPGFKKGGIVSVNHIKKQVHDNGDKVLLSANPGEAILTPDQTTQFEKLVNKLPELNYTVNTMSNLNKMPNPANLIPTGNTSIGDMVFNIDMPNVTNPDEFIKTIQTNQKMQKALRLVTTDRIAGNGKLSVNKII